MVNLSQEEINLLDIIQKDFPLTGRPFRDIGKRVGLTEEKTITLLRKLKSENIIREISILIDSKKIGYKSSLIALKADESEKKKIVPRINAHYGVSHNYLRDALFNIWFTLTIPGSWDFKKEVDLILGDNTLSSLILPALHTFKIGVQFMLTGKKGVSYNKNIPKKDDKVRGLSFYEKEILRKLQTEFPLHPEPWVILSQNCKIELNILLDNILNWKKEGIIKRISAFLRHRNLGYMANGMVCFNIPLDIIQEAGQMTSQFPEVSHCFQRPCFNKWPFSLYAMVHCKERKDCDTIISKIAKKIHCKDYKVLYSIKELKKERIKYFMEE